MKSSAGVPESLAALVTRACQLDCVYCRFRRGPAMSDALLRRCVDVLREAPCAEPTLVFLGGEPLLSLDKVLATADYARRSGKRLRLALTTNGLTLDDAAADALSERGIRVHLSLDGSRQDVQRPSRAGVRAAARPQAALALLVRRGADFAVHMTVSPEGVESFVEDALRYLEAGAPRVHFQYRVGAFWPARAARAYVREAARFALAARERGFALDPSEVMDSNEPSIVSRSVTVDTDGKAYLGCAVPAMELILPRLKACNFLGDVRTAGLRELIAAADGAEERARRLYADDPELDRVVASNLELGRLCASVRPALRGLTRAEAAR